MLRRSLLAALVLSLAIHVVAVAMTFKRPPELEYEGGGEVQHAVLGQSPFATVMAGTTAQSVKAQPVETQQVQTPTTDTAEAQKPVEAVTAAQPVAIPASTNKSIEPTRTVKAIQKVQAVQPVEATEQTLTAIKLPADMPNALAVSSDDQAKAESFPATSEIQPVQEQNPTTSPTQVQPSKPVQQEQVNTAKQSQPAQPAKTAPTAADPVEPISTRETKAVKPPRVETVVAETPTPPRQKPAPPQKIAEAKPTETFRTKQQAPDKPKAQSTRQSSAGAGGKSGRTAQKGGSQRVGKDKSAGNSDVTNYPAKVHRKLVRSVRSPRGGRKARKDAVVRFTVQKNGSVTNVRLSRSSGSKPFDQAALKAVQRAAPFPPIPGAAGRNSWTFTLPVAMR